MAAALFVRWLLDRHLGEAQPLSLLFGAVALTVWWAGLGPALVATLFGYLCSDYLFIEPRGVIAIRSPHQMISVVTYAVSSAVIIIFGEALRRANSRVTDYSRSLEAKQQQLERAEQNKDNFIATLAHELRSPLGAIAHASAFLRSRASRADRTDEAVGIIERQAQHMKRLIEDLLDMSRIARGDISLDKRRIALADVLTNCADATRSAVEKRTLSRVTHIDARDVFVLGDALRLTQVFVNLLNNASRYTSDGGEIQITTQRDGRYAVVTVRDNGIGIAPEMLERVFEMFVQAGDTSGRGHAGLGIGLALVRRIVELHGGNVTVRSDGLGRGSEFIVRLPLASDTAPDALRSFHRIGIAEREATHSQEAQRCTNAPTLQ